jgi:cytochrome c oxidase assembly protein subunit 15
LCLLTLGAVVTTFHVGMADPIWPTYPWHLLLVSWEEPRPGFLIEHSHRLAGYVVGCCIIVLTVGLWRQDRRGWVRGLGTAALLGVIIQGLLGGFRVKLNAILGPNLALIHGVFATVVFSLLATLALVTSLSWAQPPRGRPEAARRIRRASVIVTALILLQILLGGFLRHTYSTLGQRGHLLVAFTVVAAVVFLAKDILDRPALDRAVTVPVLVLAALVAVQLSLGVEAWMFKYFTPAAAASQALVRTSHVLMGSLILATSVVTTLQIFRRTAGTAVSALSPVHPLEGAA